MKMSDMQIMVFDGKELVNAFPTIQSAFDYIDVNVSEVHSKLDYVCNYFLNKGFTVRLSKEY